MTSHESGPAVRFDRLRIAVIGGDEREPEIARAAARTGASVHGYGFPLPEGGVAGVQIETTPEAAAKGADYCLFPIPLGVGHELYAPSASVPIMADESLLSQLAPGAHVFCGRVTADIAVSAATVGVTVHEYDPDRELMLLRAPAIVEGAIQLAIEHTDITIHDADVVVVGFGNIGSLLARRLLGLGARVHVAARNPIQRAGAHADGAHALPLEDLPDLAAHLDMIFSTVPARIVGGDVLERLPRGGLVLDVAPPPDHADLELAAKLGHRAVWARGLGKRAPITVGRSQWMGLERRIVDIEATGRGAQGPEER
ncbi:MAG: dipicolinate synthase subunit DpsA [Acidimicrobiales bacterium]